MDILFGLLIGVIVLWTIAGCAYAKLQDNNTKVDFILYKLDRIEDILIDKESEVEE